MMTNTQMNIDRITFSLPHTLNQSLDALKDEVKRSKSEIIKIAIENYIEHQNKQKLKKAVALMADEYENNDDLTALTALDSESFQ